MARARRACQLRGARWVRPRSAGARRQARLPQLRPGLLLPLMLCSLQTGQQGSRLLTCSAPPAGRPQRRRGGGRTHPGSRQRATGGCPSAPGRRRGGGGKGLAENMSQQQPARQGCGAGQGSAGRGWLRMHARARHQPAHRVAREAGAATTHLLRANLIRHSLDHLQRKPGAGGGAGKQATA